MNLSCSGRIIGREKQSCSHNGTYFLSAAELKQFKHRKTTERFPPRKEDFSHRKYISLCSFVELALVILKRWPDGSDGALIPSPGCQLEV